MARDLARLLAGALQGGAVRLPGVAAHVALRDRGRQIAATWHDGSGGHVDVVIPEIPGATTAEVTVVHGLRPLDPGLLTRARANDFRGLHGLWRGDARATGLALIAANRGPNATLARMGGVDGARITDETSFLIDLSKARVTRLFRGQRLVPQAAITRETVAEMAQGMTGWLAGQVGADGATTYKYWPSRGEYSRGNNMIRQFMGTVALALAARRDPGVAGAAARNATYNFARFYRDEGAFGIIDEFGKVKLGAAAVALIGILSMDDGRFSQEAKGLAAFLQEMQGPDGRFRTFLRPAERDDCHNFYPGEALLALMRLWQVTRDPRLLAAVHRGFLHYRGWHLADPNPAFVPWHTMALCLFHRATARRDVVDFVFHMNDWLCGLQNTDGPPDCVGEFFRPENARFGPPHASATGVYLEGLVEAFVLARDLGDRARADRYRVAILRGLRSLRQLQYRNDTAMFSLRHKARVRGAVRTSTHDNEVRIDNVQHGLMAIWRVLEVFGPDDWVAGPDALP
jgi:hypothetical protein